MARSSKSAVNPFVVDNLYGKLHGIIRLQWGCLADLFKEKRLFTKIGRYPLSDE